MKRTGVVTDSHSSIKRAEAAKLGVLLLPCRFIWMINVIMRMLRYER